MTMQDLNCVLMWQVEEKVDTQSARNLIVKIDMLRKQVATFEGICDVSVLSIFPTGWSFIDEPKVNQITKMVKSKVFQS